MDFLKTVVIIIFFTVEKTFKKDETTVVFSIVGDQGDLLNRSLDDPSAVDYKTLWRTNDVNNLNEATLIIPSPTRPRTIKQNHRRVIWMCVFSNYV